MPKYGNTKTTIDDVVFDSKAESRRYLQLKQMQADGVISDLKLQPSFVLLPAFVDSSGVKQRAMLYVGDFQYQTEGKTIVEDIKGYRNKTYSLKKKLFLFHFRHIEFREIQV